jgi:hypothetical protein
MSNEGTLRQHHPGKLPALQVADSRFAKFGDVIKMGIVKFIWVYTTYGKLYGKMNGIIIIHVFGMEIIWD